VTRAVLGHHKAAGLLHVPYRKRGLGVGCKHDLTEPVSSVMLYANYILGNENLLSPHTHSHTEGHTNRVIAGGIPPRIVGEI
jgi:hypothetical protein